MKDLENNLSKHNSKTVNYKRFCSYAQDKLALRNATSINQNMAEINRLLYESSEAGPQKVKKMFEAKGRIRYNKYVQKLKWFGYMNKQRHESQLLKEIEKIYGSDAIIAFGDWGGKGNIKRISMPSVGMKKLLSRKFKVYLLDEYNTSKLGWKTKKEGDKYCVNGKSLNSVLTFQMSLKTKGLIDRDNNANLNMQEIVERLVCTGMTPPCFSRTDTESKKPSKTKQKIVPKVAAKRNYQRLKMRETPGRAVYACKTCARN